MVNHNNNVKRNAKAWAPVSALALGFVLLSACTTTQKAPIDQATMNCGLLGDVCEQLTPGGKDQASLRYISPSAQWINYNKVKIEPVTFWGGDSTSVFAADQQMLVNYFSQQLKEQLEKKLDIVEHAGPGVMKLTVAMADSEAATPGLRSISMIVPSSYA
jgi:hypothetical protein